MKRLPTYLLIFVLAPALAAGCREAPSETAEESGTETVIRPGPRDVYVKVKAHFDGAVPSFDMSYHDTEVVRPGDRLSFGCDCEDGLEFTVSEPKRVIDLEALEALIEKREGETLEMKIASLRQALSEARDDLSARRDAVPPADSGDFLKGFLEDFMAVIPDAPEERLFARPWESPGFRPGDQSIGPFTVGAIGRESQWKFAWAIRAQGVPESEVSWDPHIIGHPEVKLY